MRYSDGRGDDVVMVQFDSLVVKAERNGRKKLMVVRRLARCGEMDETEHTDDKERRRCAGARIGGSQIPVRRAKSCECSPMNVGRECSPMNVG